MARFDEMGNLVPDEYDPNPLVSNDMQFRGGFNQAMNSPYAVMFGQALNNLAAISQGGRAGVDPFSAMQDVRKQNQILMDRKFQANEQRRQWQAAERYREMQAKVLEQQYQQNQGMLPNQYGNMPADIQTWKLSGSTKPYDEWAREQRPNYQTTPAALLEWNAYSQMSPADQQAYMSLQRGGRLVKGPGGALYEVRADNSITPYVGPEQAALDEGNTEGTVQSAKNWATINSDFASTMPSVHSNLRQLYGTTVKIRETLNDPSLAGNTGLLQGRLGGYTDEIAARLEVLSTLATIPALKEAGLAPVTGSDVDTIRSTFASLLRDPEANKGAIEAQIALLEQKIASAERSITYFNSNGGDMSGYLQSSFKPIKIGDGNGDDVDLEGLPED